MTKPNISQTHPMIIKREILSKLDINKRDDIHDQIPLDYTESDQRKWLVAVLDKEPILTIKEKLVLSAAKTIIPGKAHLRAASCNSISPEYPSIWFINHRPDHYGGKLELWLENLSGPKKLLLEIRMMGFTDGGATIHVQSSMSPVFSLVPIDITGSMNMVLGNIFQVAANDSGGLISLKLQFHNAQYGNWGFMDATFTGMD